MYGCNVTIFLLQNPFSFHKAILYTAKILYAGYKEISLPSEILEKITSVCSQTMGSRKLLKTNTSVFFALTLKAAG